MARGLSQGSQRADEGLSSEAAAMRSVGRRLDFGRIKRSVPRSSAGLFWELGSSWGKDGGEAGQGLRTAWESSVGVKRVSGAEPISLKSLCLPSGGCGRIKPAEHKGVSEIGEINTRLLD